ncbi:unnamed protein product [Caenorhabditis nigoni]
MLWKWFVAGLTDYSQIWCEFLCFEVFEKTTKEDEEYPKVWRAQHWKGTIRLFKTLKARTTTPSRSTWFGRQFWAGSRFQDRDANSGKKGKKLPIPGRNEEENLNSKAQGERIDDQNHPSGEERENWNILYCRDE